MKSLEQELTRAGAAIRTLERDLPRRNWVGSSPSSRSRRAPALSLAFITAAAVFVVVGVPALWVTGGDEAGAGNQGQESPPVSSAGPASPTGIAAEDFPHLALNAPGWSPSRVDDRTFAPTGERVTTVEYVQHSEDSSGGTVSLNIESQGHEGGLLAGLRSSGPSQEETITRAGATITLFTFGDHLHVLHWIEGAEAEASMVVDGPNRDEALNLFDRLEPLTAEGWTELVLSRPYTTTTSAP